MKLTKTLIVAALCAGSLLVCDTALRAQDSTNTPPPGGPPGGGMRNRMMAPTIEQLTTNLTLTADQIPKVKAVLDDQKKKLADLRADTSLSREDSRTKMLAIRTEETAKLKEILTADQFAKYQKMVPAPRNRRPAADGNTPPATPPAAPPQ